MQEVLGYFHSAEARAACGLLRHDQRFCLFEDWSNLYRGEAPTFLNLWYLLTLRPLAKMLEAAGKKKDAGKVGTEADAHERLVMEKLYDRATGLFRNGLDERGAPVSGASVHDQTMALMLGLAGETHETMLRERLLPYLRGEVVDGAKPSVFWCTYVIEELARRGHGAECVAFIRHHWSPMRATGTTWEDFEWHKEGRSASHAWSAHPSFHLVNILAGITQTAPAWKAIRFAPCFAPEIHRVRALVPSPQGDLVASWQRDGRRIRVELHLPSSVTAEVVLPGRQHAIAGETTFHAEIEVS